MSTESQSRLVSEHAHSWQSGLLGGLVGAFLMAVPILLMNPPTLQVAIPSLYGLAPLPNPTAGLFVHASHGAVLGVAFVALAGLSGLRSPGALLGGGLAWGVLTWALFAALLMPVWLSAVGSPASPPFPNVALPSLLWHLVYGLGLGLVTAAVNSQR